MVQEEREERAKEAMKDPEIVNIMQDPVPLPPLLTIKWAGPKVGPFHGRQATEVNFAGESEASGGPCGELFLDKKTRATAPDICFNSQP